MTNQQQLNQEQNPALVCLKPIYTCVSTVSYTANHKEANANQLSGLLRSFNQCKFPVVSLLSKMVDSYWWLIL